VNKKVRVKVIDVNQQKHRAIASIRNAENEQRKVREEKIWGEIERGRKYEGVVKSIANYGAFVDIGGVDGMVHITELSWTRIKHPSEVLKLGDVIQVYIKDFDTEKRRISLGYRDESENPWTKFLLAHQVNDIVEAKISNMMPFGAFAEIVPGVDGLIHISQITNKKISKPAEVLNIGDIVQVKITEINPEAKKISLSMRALIEPEQLLPEGMETAVESGEVISGEVIEAVQEIREEADPVDEVKESEAAEAAVSEEAEATEAIAAEE
jgi:4-hydroxy-3-methylbut-2-enyl diphosphate reductase